MTNEEMKARRVAERRAFAAWKHPSGTAVVLTHDDGSELRTRTRSEPWKLGDGTPVVLVEGKSGGYLLTRVRAVEDAFK